MADLAAVEGIQGEVAAAIPEMAFLRPRPVTKR